MRNRKSPNEKRNQKIYDLHEAGISYSKLAIKFKLTSARIGELVRRQRERSKLAHLFKDTSERTV